MTETLSIRLDHDARIGMTEVCKELGLSISTAFNIFAKKVSKEKRIPFDLAIDSKQDAGVNAFYELRDEAKKNKLQGMTLADINKIIAKARKNIK